MDLLTHEIVNETSKLVELLEGVFEDPVYQAVFLTAAKNGVTYKEPEELREQFDKVKRLVNDDIEYIDKLSDEVDNVTIIEMETNTGTVVGVQNIF